MRQNLWQHISDTGWPLTLAGFALAIITHLAMLATVQGLMVRGAQYGVERGRSGAGGAPSAASLPSTIELIEPVSEIAARTPVEAPEPPPLQTAQETYPVPAPAPESEQPEPPEEPDPRPAPPETTPPPEEQKPEPEPAPQSKQAPPPEKKPSTPRPASVASAASNAKAKPHKRGTGTGGAQTPTPARYLRNPAPAYPLSARRQGLEGRVLISVRVSASGRPISVTVARSSGHRILDRAAVAGVQRWRFHPARAGGVAVSSTINVPVRFRLPR